MNIFGKLAVSGLILSVASLASAAESGTTDFRVTLPETLVLYHWEDAHLILTSVNSVVSDATDREATLALGTSPYIINTDVDVNTTPNALDDEVNVTLKNSWAVRSLSNGAVKLDLVVQDSTLINETEATSTIEVQNAVLASTGTDVTGSDTASMTIPSGWTPVMGDINFNLDLTAANNSGEYNTRGVAGKAGTPGSATDTFLLTLTGNVIP